MEIRGYEDEFVELIIRFVSLPKDSSSTIECSCAMASHRFAGATYPDDPVVRIGREALTRFVDDFRLLERDRSGEAILECRELRLAFWVTDRAGHVHLQAALTEHQSGGIHQVAIAFAVDPTALPGILADLEELLAFPDLDHPPTESSL
jgi:hypothetical protein